MSKVAAYLQEHILGEVMTDDATRLALSHDGSVLEIVPEMVIYPRATNDIRKVARFAWQLAEKGHTLPITPRGSGGDETGAAIGKGVVLVTTAHMNQIFEYDTKQRLVRLQPGVNVHALSQALLLHGTAIPALPAMATYGTIGGAIANNAGGPLSGRYGEVGRWVEQLEVVLASGDVLQTGRINKRELNKRKGLAGFEGEIYRSLDNLIEDNRELIDQKIDTTVCDNVGYSSIAQVKRKDGSFDLTPLIIGSQGTLGVISEIIMKAEFVSSKYGTAVLTFASREAARDALDQLRQLEPAFLDYYDGAIFATAADNGRVYDFYKSAVGEGIVDAVVVVGFDDFNDRARARRLKKVNKIIANYEATITSVGDDIQAIAAIREVTSGLLTPNEKGVSAPPLVDGIYLPTERFEDFAKAVTALGEKYRIDLPLHGRALDNIYFTRPQLQLRRVGDKQKVFKLIDEFANLVDHHDGHLIGQDGEGRVKAPFAYKALDDDVRQLFDDIKAIFDPHGIMNPGVKQPAELKQLVAWLRPDYDVAAFAGHTLYN